MPVNRKLSNKLLSILLASTLCFSSTLSLSAPTIQIDDYFAGVKLAIEKGDVASYLKLEDGTIAQVKKIVLNPDKLDGEEHTIYLIFDGNQNLTHFSVDNGDAISLAQEQK